MNPKSSFKYIQNKLKQIKSLMIELGIDNFENVNMQSLILGQSQ